MLLFYMRNLAYNKQVTSKGHKQYFNDLAQQVIDFCNGRGIDYHNKTRNITG